MCMTKPDNMTTKEEKIHFDTCIYQFHFWEGQLFSFNAVSIMSLQHLHRSHLRRTTHKRTSTVSPFASPNFQTILVPFMPGLNAQASHAPIAEHHAKQTCTLEHMSLI